MLKTVYFRHNFLTFRLTLKSIYHFSPSLLFHAVAIPLALSHSLLLRHFFNQINIAEIINFFSLSLHSIPLSSQNAESALMFSALSTKNLHLRSTLMACDPAVHSCSFHSFIIALIIQCVLSCSLTHSLILRSHWCLLFIELLAFHTYHNSLTFACQIIFSLLLILTQSVAAYS